MLLTGGIGALGAVYVARGYASGPTADVAPVHYTQILWGAGIGALFFGELPDLYTVIGAAIIVGAGLLLIYFSRKPPKDLALPTKKP